jgi:hypothetical protein
MIEVHFLVNSGKLLWTMSPASSGSTEDVVCVTFAAADSARESERRAFEVIRETLRQENADWIKPSLNGWWFDLAGLSGFINQPGAVPWLKGTVVVKPEIKRASDVGDGGQVEFSFFITPDDINQASVRTAVRSNRKEVFISYSHRDKSWLERLRVHLRPLERQGLLELFDDTKIQAGARWREEIKAALDRARVAILLISADFLASDFIAEDELPPLLKKAQAGGATILPVIVSACRFSKEKALSEYQAVNDPRMPLASLTPANVEEVLTAVADAVENALQGADREGPRNPPIAIPQYEQQQLGPKSKSAQTLLGLITAEKDSDKGIVEILPSKGRQTFFQTSLFTHGKSHKMETRAFKEGIAELVQGGWLYKLGYADGGLRYEFRDDRRRLRARETVSSASPSVSIPVAVAVPGQGTCSRITL